MASRPPAHDPSASRTPPVQRRRLFRAETYQPSVSRDTESTASTESRDERQQPPNRQNAAVAGRKMQIPRSPTRTSANARVPRQKVRNIKGLATKSGRAMLLDKPKGSAKRKTGKPVRKDRAAIEIQRYQKSTGLLMQKLPFSRLIREISQQYAIQSPIDSGNRWTVDAMWCIQEAAEAYLVYLLEESYLFSLHARRVTLMPRDIRLWKRLQNPRR